MVDDKHFHHFKLNEIAATFPDTAETLLLDKYLTDEAEASARVFRVYRETPPHYHVGSDETCMCFREEARSGWATRRTRGSLRAGDLLVFKRRTVHALPEILEGPVVFLAIDTPRRDPKDIFS